jgi:hypothetical protein
MASRSSRGWLGETYQGSKRGRNVSGDFGHEMFPEKYERTEIEEEPVSEQLNQEWRMNLSSFDPDSPTFAYELPRRNVMSRNHINLRNGVWGASTDPYANSGGGGYNTNAGREDLTGGPSNTDENSGWDNQFHDVDPRGYSDQQPWDEYRRLITAQMRRFDFRDDGDYSVTSGGIHPNTMYQNIRSAQNWVKARLKIFDTSFDNMHPGGIGVYDHVSNVFKSSREGTSVAGEDDKMSTTWEDPENRQRLTMHLSNIVHGGSKAFRVNTTTDHKVNVAAYGKLYSQRGLIPHESQLRILEDDTPWNKIEGSKNVPKNLVKLMSTALQEKDGLDPKTASQSARLMYQDSAMSGHGEEQFRGLRGEESEQGNDKRSRKLTKDVMALLGFVEQDVKFLESRCSDPGKQGKRARQELANLYKMAEVLHALPANVKLDLRNELILRSAGMGLRMADPSKVQGQVVVNPKIVQRMDLMTRRTEKPGDPNNNREWAVGDSEDQLSKKDHINVPIFVYKSASKLSEDLDFNRRSAESTDKKHNDVRAATAHRAKSYKNLVKTAEKIQRNKREGRNTRELADTDPNLVYRTKKIGETDPYEAMQNAITDNKFLTSGVGKRHGGKLGVKSAARRYIQSEPFNVNDPVAQRQGMVRKNGQNLVQSNRL